MMVTGDEGGDGYGMVLIVMVMMMGSVMLMLIKANSDLEKSSHSAGDRAGLWGRQNRAIQN